MFSRMEKSTIKYKKERGYESMKKFTSLILALTMIASFSIGAFAYDLDEEILDDEYNIIFIDKDGEISYGYEESAANPIAIPDPTSSRASGIVVTASDVWKVVGEVGDDYVETWAYGYVTSSSYHYARAELWLGNSICVSGFQEYGTGQVYSRSFYCWESGTTAQIFYGS